MLGKVGAVRQALYLCFPDQPRTEVNSLVDTDKGLKYAIAAFKLEEIPERVMLVSMQYQAAVSLVGFLWITNRRLLFVTAIGNATIGSHPLYREISYSSIRKIIFEQSHWFQNAKLILHLDSEKVLFESIVKPQPLQQFVDYLREKVADPRSLAPDTETMFAEETTNIDLISELERLNNLKKEHAVTEEEFEIAKKKLLSL